MNCLNCGFLLEQGDVDSRQEWTETNYYCPECKKFYIRRTEYQSQSSLTSSDTLKEIKE